MRVARRAPVLASLLLAIGALTPIGSAAAAAAPGDLDPSFDTDGLVVTPTGGGNNQVDAIALQPDGRIVAVGGAQDVVLARYNLDGSLDAGFGTGGFVVSNFGSNENARGVAIQPDGKIVIVASQGCCGNVGIVVARYASNGTLDPTFGTGGIAALSDPGSEDYGEALALQPDGGILVAGSRNLELLVVRLDADGALDPTFGAGGLAVPFPGEDGQATGVAVLPDARILATGHRPLCCATHSDVEVVRLNADGSADTTFGPDLTGRVLADLDGNSDDFVADAAIDSGGRIVVAGSSAKVFQQSNVAVARFTADGALDPGFGTGGVVISDLGADEQGRAVAIAQDDRVIVAGQSTGNSASDFVIASYLEDGSPDIGFGTGGVVKTDFGNTDDKALAVAIQSDGSIVAGGYNLAGSYKFALARYSGVGPVVTATSPGAPTGVTAAAGDGQVSVSWLAPASDGFSTITSYTVTAAPGGASQSVAGGTTVAAIGGLTNATPYTFTVTATNVIGTGPASAPSDPATPQAGAPPPQTASETIPPSGGNATTDPTGTGPTAADPITTAVTVPPTAGGGSVTIAETAVNLTAPTGYQFLGQQVDITSTAATSFSNPLTIVFTIDSSVLLAATGMATPPPESIEITRAEGSSPVVIAACPTSDPDACVSDRQYDANGDLRITIVTGSASHWNTAVKPIAVAVTDSGYSPKAVTAAQGGIVLWTFSGSKPHSVTDSLKLGPGKTLLFSSGPVTTGRFGSAFRAAGSYSYGSTVKGDPGTFTGTVGVPVRISPAGGSTATSFTVTWSSATMSGYVFDVQYRFMKAGGKSWSRVTAWKSGVSTTNGSFSPTSGAGTYAFSARLRNATTGLATGWSPEINVVVTP